MPLPIRVLALAFSALPALTARAQVQTATPIEHLIVVVGENLSFDNLFGTYRPRSNAKIRNLLSEGIVNRDGGPGSEFAKAMQRRAEVHDSYEVTPHIVIFTLNCRDPGQAAAPLVGAQPRPASRRLRSLRSGQPPCHRRPDELVPVLV